MTNTPYTHHPAEQVPAINLPALAKTSEVAAEMGMSPGTLANMRWRSSQTGKLEGPAWVKIGSAVRYRRDDVLSFIGSLSPVGSAA